MGNPLVLLVAYHFPPDNAIGGARPYRFYKYLKRLGYECHVLTASVQEKDGGTGGVAEIEYIPDPLRVQPRSGIAWQAERIGWKFFLRSEMALGWSAGVFRAGKAFLNSRRDSGDVTILSSAPPLGTHLAAMRLAAISGCPWIADFRDPIHSPNGEHAVFQKAFGPAIEGWVLNKADSILANTDAMHGVWSARYPGLGGKLHMLWNGYDSEDAVDTYSILARKRKVLSHVGELYGGRDIRPILHAASLLLKSGRLAAGTIAICQTGVAEASELPEPAFLEAAQRDGWLELRLAVPRKEARTIALESDGLLLIQPHTAVQVPGKLFEYLRMGRPIFAYVVRDSPVERILARAGVPYECVYPEHSTEEMALKLLSFLQNLTGVPASPSAWFEETFEASRQIETLDVLARSLHSGSV